LALIIISEDDNSFGDKVSISNDSEANDFVKPLSFLKIACVEFGVLLVSTGCDFNSSFSSTSTSFRSELFNKMDFSFEQDSLE